MQYTFVEITGFTRRVVELGLEDDLRTLRTRLRANPRAGAVEPGTGGLRKIRMADAARGKGTRGGVRVHCLFVPDRETLYLVSLYPKDEQATLTPDQKRVLSRLARIITTE